MSLSQYGCIARRSNGTLWAWGVNSNGELGLNSGTTARSSPTQIGALTTWTNNFNATSGNQCHAIQTNGTLWHWGGSLFGIAFGADYPAAGVSRSSPVQIGAVTTWADTFGTQFNFQATRTNGTWWYNGVAPQKGTFDNTPTSAWVQIGALTNWITNRRFKYCGRIENGSTVHPLYHLFRPS
jgi:alpha-tubulin suppressor-like RCC1 family protein